MLRKFRIGAVRILGTAGALLALATTAAPADAAANDEAARSLIESAFKENPKSSTGNKKAGAKLNVARSICGKDNCSDEVQAELRVAQGTLYAYSGSSALAKSAFKEALALDPNVKLRKGHDGPKVKALWDEVKGGDKPAPKPAPKPDGEAAPKPDTAPAPKAPPAPKKDTRKKVDECETGSGKTPRGWNSYKSFCYFSEAVSAEAAQEWVNCADYASRAADAEERSTARYLSAQCSERAGKWVTALQGYQDVVAVATREGKKKTASEASARAKFLRERIPKIVLQLPPNATEVKVFIDGDLANPDQVAGEMWINPGKRLIEVKGKMGNDKLDWRQTITIGEGQKRVIEVAKGELDPAVQRCIEKATSPDEIERCLSSRGPSDFTFTVNTEVSGYLDNDNVEVFSPSLSLQAENAVDGWGVGAAFLVDVVTAASADIVATASPRWVEVRYVPALNAHVKVSDVDIGVNGVVSVEPDYLAIGAGASFAVDLLQKNVTPSLRYDFGYDIQGRAGTPFDVFSTKIHRHGITGAVTFVVNKSTLFIPSATAVLEFGDTSKPYRYLATFPPGTQLLNGETTTSVDNLRTPVKIADQLPTTRQRYALAGALATRWTDVTLRLSERLYADSWGLFATTTDFLLPIDIVKQFRLWPHLRFHAQSGVQFWEIGYVVESNPNGGLTIPLLRTADRELGPILQGTAGVGTAIDLVGDDSLVLKLKVDVIYTRFMDHLYQQQRLGGFGAADLDIVFE